MKKFCPKCGKETNSLFDKLCVDCFFSEKKLLVLPEKIVLQCCKKCGKIFFGGKWLGESEELLEKIVLESASIKFSSFNPVVSFFYSREAVEARVDVFGFVGNSRISVSGNVLLCKKSALCDSCMKLSSGYFEATVQLRFEKKVFVEKAEKLVFEARRFLENLRKKDSLAVVVAVKTVGSGVDFVVGSKRAGKMLAEHFAKNSGQKIRTSFSLAGVTKDGKQKKRFTYCVRL